MAFFRVGMRVRNLRDATTGIVYEIDAEEDRCVGVKMDRAGMGFDSFDRPKPYPAGDICFDYPNHWQPIIDKQEPCESEFKASLDRLLEQVGEGVG